MTLLIPDIDECSEGSYRCEQHCHNSVGSYACSCDSGFRLDGDGLGCNGILLLWYHNIIIIRVMIMTQ